MGVAVVLWVVCWLIRCKKSDSYTRSGIKTKYEKEKIFLAKTLRVNKPAMKNFLKKSVFRSQRYRSRTLTYKINSHNMSSVWS